MSSDPIFLVNKMALRLGERGFRVVPVHAGGKNPIGERWPETATADPELLAQRFNGSAVNIGVACGPQPNELNLVVLDVDPKNGGDVAYKALIDRYGPFSATAMHRTPTGGWHVFFNGPKGVRFTNANSFEDGLDTRGDGGQVVVPPSSRLIGDVVTHYTEYEPGLGVWRHPVTDMVPEMVPLFLPPVVPKAAARPSQEPTDSLADWLRAHFDWEGVLLAQGHTLVRRSGDELYFAHPTATSEHSAVVHLSDCMMNAWSTNMPRHPRGKVSRDGSVPWSPYDWLLATEFGYDVAALMRELDRRRGGGWRPAGGPPPSTASHGRLANATVETTVSGQMPTVDSDYWSASKRNAHVLAAARARMVSPDALDLVVFALESLLIPSSFLLPAIVGGRQPLNMLSCLVANTGLFKTATLDAARDLMGPFPPWAVQINMGTGEGIGAMFLKEQTEPSKNGKGVVKTGRMVRNEVEAVFFEADEGRGLSEMAQRHGATIIANLCKAWSGSTLGEANADPMKRRYVLDRDYRVAALVNIQPSAFELLFSQANTGTGLTGRFMFSGTLDPDIPDVRGPDPGPLEHPMLNKAKEPVVLEIDQVIIDRAEAEIRHRHRTASLGTTLDATAQNAAVIARMAGIGTLVDGRRRITLDDWEIATLRAAASVSCLNVLAEWAISRKGAEDYKRDVAKARSELVIEDVKGRQAVARMAERLRDLVTQRPWGINKLKREVSSAGTRHRFDAALALAVSNGWVRVVEGRVEHV